MTSVTYLADFSGLSAIPRRAASVPVPEATLPSMPFCWSVRKVVSTYAGPCMRVVKVGPGGLADIGFDERGRLDEEALEDHLAGADGRVQTWYNQGSAGSGGNFTSNAYQPEIQDDEELHDLGPYDRPALESGGAPMVMVDSALARLPANFTVMAVIDPSAGCEQEHVVGFGGHWAVRSIPTRRSSFRFRAAPGHFKQTGGDADQWPDRATRVGWTVSQSGQIVTCVRRLKGKVDTYTFSYGWGNYDGSAFTLFGAGSSSMFSGLCSEVLIFVPRLSTQQITDIEAAQIAYYGVG